MEIFFLSWSLLSSTLIMNRCIPSTWNSLHRILQRGWKAVSPRYWFELAFSCSFRSPHYPLNKVFVFMWHWGKPPPTELFHNPLGKFALCYCHTKVVVKVVPEVLQQVSSSLPFLSGNSLLNSGFPETAYFAPRPTAHDEHRAHIKYRGELDHMTILHISITSALCHWLLQNQNYKKINMHAQYFQTGRFEFVNFQAPALVGEHKFAITSSILKWLDVLFTGNWVGVYSIQ